jgi:hypothetical protein
MSTAVVQLTSGAFLSLAMVATAAAQGSPAATQAGKTSQTYTIVGCLVQGDPTAEGDRRSPSGTATSNEFFVRTPTVAVPVGTTVAVGTPGTTSTITSAGTPTTDSLYRITGLGGDELRPHVGHRVELQGQLTDGAKEATSAKTTVDSTGRATTKVETRPIVAGSLRATTIKMLSASCP